MLHEVAARLGVQDVDEGEPERREALGDGRVGRADVRVVLLEDALDVVLRREADADAVRADRLGDGRGDLDGEACAVLGGAAVLVGAGVRDGGEELVHEVPVRAVHLDAVEAGGDRVAGGTGEALDGLADLVGGELVRHGHVRLRAVGEVGLPGAATAEGPTIRGVCEMSVCETRPPCMSCMTMVPPRSCTASVTRRQPATCSSVSMPG